MALVLIVLTFMIVWLMPSLSWWLNYIQQWNHRELDSEMFEEFLQKWLGLAPVYMAFHGQKEF